VEATNMSGREKMLLDNALDALDRLFNRDNSVIDVCALLFATAEALQSTPHLSEFERPLAELLAIVRSGESTEEKRDRALAVTDELRHYLAGLSEEGVLLANRTEKNPAISTKLIRRGWLKRTIIVTLPDGHHIVEYDGTGLGYEQVWVDGDVIRKRSLVWFVPRFDFKLGDWHSVIEVRVWPWLLLRSLVLLVGDQVIYSE
jgi:hypothetical protein